jgi:hypothetical protein
MPALQIPDAGAERKPWAANSLKGSIDLTLSWSNRLFLRALHVMPSLRITNSVQENVRWLYATNAATTTTRASR